MSVSFRKHSFDKKFNDKKFQEFWRLSTVKLCIMSIFISWSYFCTVKSDYLAKNCRTYYLETKFSADGSVKKKSPKKQKEKQLTKFSRNSEMTWHYLLLLVYGFIFFQIVYNWICAASKVSVFRVILVRILPHLVWIRRDIFSALQGYNHGHNILRLFYILPNFILATSETKRDY